MPEVFVKFNSLEEAMEALKGKGGLAHSVPQAAPFPAAPTYAPAPAPTYAPAPQQAPAVNPPSTLANPVQAPAGGGYTQQNIVAQAQIYAQAHGPRGVKAVFAEFGATAASNVDPAHYPALMQRLMAV